MVVAAGSLLALAACGGSSSSTAAKLMPTNLGHGQCQASALSDGSTYAQVAISGGATCQQAAKVASAAAAAGGSGDSADGFSCSATKEGKGSRWAGAWSGTYYAYSCADGNKQVAFNWGNNYSYGQ